MRGEEKGGWVLACRAWCCWCWVCAGVYLMSTCIRLMINDFGDVQVILAESEGCQLDVEINSYGETPLFEALQCGSSDFARTLIQRSAVYSRGALLMSCVITRSLMPVRRRCRGCNLRHVSVLGQLAPCTAIRYASAPVEEGCKRRGASD